ncbi:MAG: hypothetical protein BGO69_03995 [Bacteroidetes bacterium 46-16]|nr:MAG: hypothetical protein BGO69_03995 [Bacteroidetes bacterium 46-16]
MSRFSEFELKHKLYLKLFGWFIIAVVFAVSVFDEKQRRDTCMMYCVADSALSFHGKVISIMIGDHAVPRITVLDSGWKRIHYPGSWSGTVYDAKVGDSVTKEPNNMDIRIFRNKTEIKYSYAKNPKRTCSSMCGW